MDQRAELCKICNKSFTNLNVHLRMKHKMLRADYNRKFGSENGLVEVDEEIEPKSPSPERDINQVTLQDFLNTYGLDEAQLREMLSIRKAVGTTTDLRTELQERRSKARGKALKLLDRDEIKTTDLDLAEILSKEFGYRVIDVVRFRTPDEPKHWILRR